MNIGKENFSKWLTIRQICQLLPYQNFPVYSNALVYLIISTAFSTNLGHLFVAVYNVSVGHYVSLFSIFVFG